MLKGLLKTQKSFLAGCILTLCVSSSVYSQNRVDCANAKTQSEINACTQIEYQKVDKELNTLYKKIIPKLNESQKATLVQSQKRWIAFRDDYSRIYSLIYKGGTMATAAVIKCKTETTRARIIELKQLLDQIDL
ncbi:lysozyme inhibitor LprI family protein [Pararcticibacter amylolyticus]|uniref:Lysozyme inhibitor LprI-like N-terminal domain-containing protein n=1 Tax=Pararcticibacter amylolyticus TaxID=2173175 RepID=A0A2U2P939_9SPHI|nr:hypothetical protein DDR33_25035 [Pararcticibacter amylolyticus]